MQNAQSAVSVFSADQTERTPLSVLTSSLAQLVVNSEDEFMSLGMNLQKIQFMSSNQRQKISAAMGLFKAEEDTGVLNQVSTYVRHSQQETQAAQQTAAKLCDNLNQILKLMDSIAKKNPALERVGLFLRVIGINTGIECARHRQMEAMFKVVSNDTISLADQISVATNTFGDQLSAAKADQEKTLSGAQASINSLTILVQSSQLATGKALEKVTELIAYSISMVNEAERMAVKITSEINQVVMGIQFHDNLRQRIEHINEALLETEGLSAAATEEDACKVYLSVELQKAQLDNLVGELDQLHRTQLQALSNILTEVSGLETRLESMTSKQTRVSGQENPVTILLSGISALENLNAESLALSRNISSSAEHAEQISIDMQTAIKGTFVIANNVKINALNAIIKASKFGHSGEALQVLAQGMVTVSIDTRQLVVGFNELLDQLSQLARNDGSTDFEKPEIANAVEFDSVGVQQVFHDFNDEVRASKDACNSLSQSLEHEQQGLAFLTELKNALQHYAELLGQHAEAICPQNQELLATMRANFGESIEARYTMNEERDIHNQLRQPQKIAVSVLPPANKNVDDCLFIDEPTASVPSSGPELWGDSPVAAVTASVDLFEGESVTEPIVDNVEIELWNTAQTPAAGEVELFDQTPVDTGAEVIELWSEPLAVVESDTCETVQILAGADGPPETRINIEETEKQKEDFGDNIELF